MLQCFREKSDLFGRHIWHSSGRRKADGPLLIHVAQHESRVYEKSQQQNPDVFLDNDHFSCDMALTQRMQLAFVKHPGFSGGGMEADRSHCCRLNGALGTADGEQVDVSNSAQKRGWRMAGSFPV